MGRMAPASCILAPAAAAFCRARRAKWPSEEGGGSSPSGSHATPVRCSGWQAGRRICRVHGCKQGQQPLCVRGCAELPLQPTHLPAPHLRRCWQLQRPRLRQQLRHWQPEWRCCAGQRERLHSGGVRRQRKAGVGRRRRQSSPHMPGAVPRRCRMSRMALSACFPRLTVKHSGRTGLLHLRPCGWGVPPPQFGSRQHLRAPVWQ